MPHLLVPKDTWKKIEDYQKKKNAKIIRANASKMRAEFQDLESAILGFCNQIDLV